MEGIIVILGIGLFVWAVVKALSGGVKVLPCRACKGPVSNKAGRCPHCGHPVR